MLSFPSTHNLHAERERDPSVQEARRVPPGEVGATGRFTRPRNASNHRSQKCRPGPCFSKGERAQQRTAGAEKRNPFRSLKHGH